MAIRFSHEIHEPWDGFHPSGVCHKILPLRGRWRIERKREFLSLYPSVSCPQHHLHGYIRDGEWLPVRDYYFGHLAREEVQRRIGLAEDEALEFGGGYEGAILALASRYVIPRRTRDISGNGGADPRPQDAGVGEQDRHEPAEPG